MENTMDAALEHVKNRAEYLSRCSYTYIIHLSLKELGIPPGSDASYLAKKTVELLYEHPGTTLTNGIYYSVGLFCNSQKGAASVESSIRRAIQQAWEERDEEIWGCYFPVGKIGRTECPANKDFLMAVVDFVITWKGFCEEVNYGK